APVSLIRISLIVHNKSNIEWRFFMKKSLVILITCLTLFSYSPVQAETVTKNDIQLRDDLIFIMLYPSIQQELKKQYGEIKQNYCGEITQIKKLPIGTYLFNVTVQVTTFEGAHGPPNDLVTITFSNEKSIEWQAIDFKRKRLKPNEITECRHPL
ncbi:DUF3888 domain-containing protein, partial [Photobacterium sagamiensis]|uniref:DUF3888 domain-containing protein n=1 Tax=Photobacterium sagamiensis TaxID=2910241 RepID=UPI003D0D3179